MAIPAPPAPPPPQRCWGGDVIRGRITAEAKVSWFSRRTLKVPARTLKMGTFITRSVSDSSPAPPHLSKCVEFFVNLMVFGEGMSGGRQHNVDTNGILHKNIK